MFKSPKCTRNSTNKLLVKINIFFFVIIIYAARLKVRTNFQNEKTLLFEWDLLNPQFSIQRQTINHLGAFYFFACHRLKNKHHKYPPLPCFLRSKNQKGIAYIMTSTYLYTICVNKFEKKLFLIFLFSEIFYIVNFFPGSSSLSSLSEIYTKYY